MEYFFFLLLVIIHFKQIQQFLFPSDKLENKNNKLGHHVKIFSFQPFNKSKHIIFAIKYYFTIHSSHHAYINGRDSMFINIFTLMFVILKHHLEN